MATRLAELLPAYMVPRFFEVTDELPLTPTQRVQEYLLRDRGNGPATWDRAPRGTRVFQLCLSMTTMMIAPAGNG